MSGESDVIIWTHGWVICGRCGYDSKAANEPHVYLADSERLECPKCRSYECRPFDDDDDQEREPLKLEFEMPKGATLMTAVVVCQGMDADGEIGQWVIGDQDVRKVETLGLLTWGIEAVKDRMYTADDEEED